MDLTRADPHHEAEGQREGKIPGQPEENITQSPKDAANQQDGSAGCGVFRDMCVCVCGCWDLT